MNGNQFEEQAKPLGVAKPRRGRPPRKEKPLEATPRREIAEKAKEKEESRHQEVASSMFAKIPARPDFDPENPVILHVRVDNTLERLDVHGWEFSQDKAYITQRRGMMVNTIIIPLSRISFIQEMRFIREQQQTPVEYIVPEARGLAKAAPEQAPGGYVVDVEKAKAHFKRDARKMKKDFYIPEKEDAEPAAPGGAVTGAVLLGEGAK